MEDLYELLGRTLPQSDSLSALQAHSRRRGLDLLTLDEINKEIGGVREGARGKRKRA
jgi:hypothetical protein